MAVIKKIKESELIGGTQDDEDVYPITHTKAIYDSYNRNLDDLLQNGLVEPISFEEIDSL